MHVQLFIFITAIVFYNHFKDNTTNEPLNTYNRKRFIVVMMILFTLQSGLRNIAVGPDTYRYYYHFEQAILSSWSQLFNNMETFLTDGEGKDPGYHILQKVFSSVLPSYRLYLIAVASFFFYALGKTLFNFTTSNKEVLVSLAIYQCLYYGFFSITGIRQTIATGFLLLSIPYVIDRTPQKFVLYLIFAALIHKTALLFAPFYLFPLLKKGKIVIISAFVLFIPMRLFGAMIAKYIVMGSMFEQYADFLEQEDSTGAYVFTAYISMIGVLLFFYFNKIKSDSSDSKTLPILTSSVAFAIMLTPLTLIDPANMRIVQYYSIFGLFALPQCLSRIENSYKIKMCMLAFVFFAFYSMERVKPYSFFWEQMELGTNYGGGTISDFDIRY